MNLMLARKTSFSCVHRYAQPAFSAEKNQLEFGNCYLPHGHGHTYQLEAFLQGPLDRQTGMIMNLRDVDIILKKVTSRLQDKHLDQEVSEFKNLIPTTENIARVLAGDIQQELKDTRVKLARLRLYENDALWVDIYP